MDKTITRKSLLGLAAGAALALGLGLAPALSTAALAQEAAGDQAQEQAAETFEFTDSAGRTVQLPRDITMVAPSGPLTQQVLEMMKVLHHDGDGSCDHSALLKYYQKLTGETLHH